MTGQADCTERRAAMDVAGWGYVECIRGEHEGACRFGQIVHDDGEFRKAKADA